jgi:hypothetical protein
MEAGAGEPDRLSAAAGGVERAPGECKQLRREGAGAGRHRRNGCAGVERASDDRS